MKLIETKRDINYDGMNMTVEGELVPIATVNMNSGSRPTFFEHHVLLWRDPEIGITAKILKGMGNASWLGFQ